MHEKKLFFCAAGRAAETTNPLALAPFADRSQPARHPRQTPTSMGRTHAPAQNSCLVETRKYENERKIDQNSNRKNEKAARTGFDCHNKNMNSKAKMN